MDVMLTSGLLFGVAITAALIASLLRARRLSRSPSGGAHATSRPVRSIRRNPKMLVSSVDDDDGDDEEEEAAGGGDMGDGHGDGDDDYDDERGNTRGSASKAMARSINTRGCKRASGRAHASKPPAQSAGTRDTAPESAVVARVNTSVNTWAAGKDFYQMADGLAGAPPAGRPPTPSPQACSWFCCSCFVVRASLSVSRCPLTCEDRWIESLA